MINVVTFDSHCTFVFHVGWTPFMNSRAEKKIDVDVAERSLTNLFKLLLTAVAIPDKWGLFSLSTSYEKYNYIILSTGI